MRMQPTHPIDSLTEKEKQTLRLIVRGHDAKSIARSLNLSVHTINERLREARRKMAVSSSREAARLLMDAEGDEAPSARPDSLRDMKIGADRFAAQGDEEDAPTRGAGLVYRHSPIFIGVMLMTLVLGLLALAALPQTDGSAQPQRTAARPVETEAATHARQWLELIDQERWADSYQGTGSSFHKNNSLEVWTAVSKQARGPLGALISRELMSQENLPAPPMGYEMLKFRSRFANKAQTIETVTLAREDGRWRVAGVMID